MNTILNKSTVNY